MPSDVRCQESVKGRGSRSSFRTDGGAALYEIVMGSHIFAGIVSRIRLEFQHRSRKFWGGLTVKFLGAACVHRRFCSSKGKQRTTLPLQAGSVARHPHHDRDIGVETGALRPTIIRKSDPKPAACRESQFSRSSSVRLWFRPMGYFRGSGGMCSGQRRGTGTGNSQPSVHISTNVAARF